MNIIFESCSNRLNEELVFDNWGSRNTSFTDLDVVIGPDGKVYNTKLIVSYVNAACSILSSITDGALNPYLDALPIIYTFEVPTMATDTVSIMINPGFVEELVQVCGNSPAGVAFVILHEVYHNIFKHHEREAADPVKFSDHAKANAAQDYEINWIIEHTFPDRRSEKAANAKGDTIYDKDGHVKQIFGGITEKLNGCIDEKYKDDIWEVIYDKLDSVPNPTPQKEKDAMKMSPDMEEGYRDGWEDAIRDLRIQGLVESVFFSKEFLKNCTKLYEASLNKNKDYNAGYDLGYEAAMNVIKALSQGGKGVSSPMGPSNPPFEPISKKLTPITPKFPINDNNSESSEDSQSDPNTPVNINKNSQNKNSGNSNSQNQQSQQSQSNSQQGQQQGQQQGSQQSNGQGQEDSSTNGENGNQSIDGSTGNSSNSVQGANTKGVYKNGIETSTDSETNSGTGKDSYEAGSGEDGMTPEEIQERVEKLKAERGIKKVGLADGGYSGKGDLSTSTIHTISSDKGAEIAKSAGVKESTVQKGESILKNNEALKKIAAKLDEISRINGGSPGSPGRGIGGYVDQIIEILKPHINWKEVLKDKLIGYFSELIDVGYSKKGLARDAYYHFDDYEGETANRLVLFADTSGSMFAPGSLERVLTEINEICLGVGAREIDFVQFNDGIYRNTVFTAGNLPEKIDFVGLRSGGTTYSECFQYLEEKYLDQGLTFNAAIIMTDSDVFYSLNQLEAIHPYDTDWAYKLTWMIVCDDNESVRELPYWSEEECVILVPRADFDKSLSFVTTSSKNDKDVNESNKISKPIFNNMKNRRCINNKINEDYFQGFDDDDEILDNTSDEDEQIKKMLDSIKISRASVSGVDLTKYYDEIKQYFSKAVINEHRIYDNYEQYSNTYGSNRQTGIVLNNDGTVDVYGPLEIDLYRIPFSEYVYINEIHDVPNRSEKGSFTASNGMCSTLPAGFPERVDGDFTLRNFNNLLTLENTPREVGGSVIITLCKSLKPVKSNIRLVGGVVISDCGIDEDNILKDAEYNDASTVDQRIAEGIRYKSVSSLNEAFRSNIFRRIFNKRDNKDAVEAIKDIPIFWSEIPDENIFPCYNNVQKSLQLRRVVNRDVTGYGITIWCDSNDRISVIGTGDNKSSYTDDEGKEKSWFGESWLYVAPGVISRLNERISLVRKAHSGDTNAQEECDQLGINYNKSDIYTKSYMIRKKDDMVFPHLYFIPDLCSRAYIIKGTNDVKAEDLRNPELYKNFTYLTQKSRRSAFHNERLDAIKNTYLTTKEDLSNSPLARRYYNYLLTDDVVRNLFNEKIDFNTAINTISQMINSTKTIVELVRKEIIKMYTDKLLDPVQVDSLYNQLKSYNYVYILNGLKSIKNRLITERDNAGSSRSYKDYRDTTYTASKIMTNIKANLANSSTLAGSYNDRTIIASYITLSSKLAEFLTDIKAFLRGDKTILNKYFEYFDE